MLANIYRTKDSEPISVEAFIPDIFKETETKKPKAQTVEEQKMVLKQIASWAKKNKLTKKVKSGSKFTTGGSGLTMKEKK